MAGPTSDRVAEWEGGSLSDLVATLQASALPVRIEVIAPGSMGSSAGEVHLIAGGLAEAFAGSLRRDDAMAALQRLEGARFLVECRLPDPESGTLSQPGPAAGSLKERPLPSLMRYCEDYVLTCQLEVGRGQERAVVHYKRGELINTTIDGMDADDRLPDMLGWPDGTYQIVLAEPELPSPQRRRDSQPLPRGAESAAKAERKRLPTLPGTGGRTGGTPPSPTSQVKAAAKGPEITLPFAPTKAPPEQSKPPAVPPVSSLRLSPQPDLGKPSLAEASVAQQMTRRGMPSIPAVPPVPQPAPLKPAVRPPTSAQPLPGASKPSAPPLARPTPVAPSQPAPGVTPQPVIASKPALTARPTAPLSAGKPAAPAPFKLATPVAPASTKPAAPPAPVKPVAPTAQPLTPARPAAPVRPAAPTAPTSAKGAAEPAPAGSTKLGMPSVEAAQKVAAPSASAKPAAPAAPAKQAPSATAPAKPAVAKPTSPPAQAAGEKAARAQVVRKATTASRVGVGQLSKAETHPSASNDLKPASGMIEARPRRLSHPRPAAAPVEVAEEPPPVSRPLTPAPVTPHVTPRRVRTSARKIPARPVRIYVFMGLAIGIGIVLAYWLYYKMNIGSG